MDKNQEILEISKLVFELTLVGSTTSNLDELLARLVSVLRNIPGIRIQQKGAILLYNPRQALVQVAQINLPPAILANHASGELDGIAPEFWPSAYVTALSAEKALPAGQPDESFVVLPLAEDQRPLGLGILFIEEGWRLDPVELEFMSDLARALSGLVMRTLINETLRARELELEDARTDAIRRLGAASEYRDNDTGMHVMRMTQFSTAIGRAMNLSEQQREMLGIVAPMHDVGKIGIADAILLKPGRLTPEEFEVMKTHTEIGSRILKGEDVLICAAREVALAHHEHWDGSGYPRGLAGEEIPVLARICALADVFDALTSERAYKQAWPLQDAIDWINGQSGRKFDPAVVAAFNQVLPEILRFRELYRDDVIDPNEVIDLPEVAPSHDPWVRWENRLSVGIDGIDAHHRYLVELLNDLYVVVRDKRGSREVARILKSLDQYAHVHFHAEERLMEHFGFAGLERQQRQHQRFEKKLRLFRNELNENPLTAPHDILVFLREWLVHHISHEDAQLRSLVSAS